MLATQNIEFVSLLSHVTKIYSNHPAQPNQQINNLLLFSFLQRLIAAHY